MASITTIGLTNDSRSEYDEVRRMSQQSSIAENFCYIGCHWLPICLGVSHRTPFYITLHCTAMKFNLYADFRHTLSRHSHVTTFWRGRERASFLLPRCTRRQMAAALQSWHASDEQLIHHQVIEKRSKHGRLVVDCINNVSALHTVTCIGDRM